MATNILGIFISLLIIAPFILIVIWAIKYQKRIFIKGWDKIEDLLKRNQARITTVIPADRRVLLNLEAEWKGKKLEIFNQYEGAGKSRTLFTYIKLHTNSKTLPSFELYKENFFTRTGEKIGIKDIKTGDAEFDKIYRLHSASEAETQRFFDMSLQNKLMDEKKTFFGNLSSSQGLITVKIGSHPGHKTMWPFFESMLSVLLAMGEKAK